MGPEIVIWDRPNISFHLAFIYFYKTKYMAGVKANYYALSCKTIWNIVLVLKLVIKKVMSLSRTF